MIELNFNQEGTVGKKDDEISQETMNSCMGMLLNVLSMSVWIYCAAKVTGSWELGVGGLALGAWVRRWRA